MEKFGIVTINYNRKQVLNLFLASIDRLRALVGFFPVVCVSGEEDSNACQSHNVVHLTRMNKPVTEKWQKGFRYFQNEVKPDYCVICGSDDIISNDLMLKLTEAMDKDYDLIGIREIYFYGAYGQYKGKLIHLVRPHMLGVCRTIHRRVLDQIDWKPFPKRLNSSMDGLCMRTIKPYVKSQYIVQGMVTDVKTAVNLNHIDFWLKRVKTLTAPGLFYDYLSERELEILNTL